MIPPASAAESLQAARLTKATRRWPRSSLELASSQKAVSSTKTERGSNAWDKLGTVSIRNETGHLDLRRGRDVEARREIAWRADQAGEPMELVPR
jgi:hypothetical protein